MYKINQSTKVQESGGSSAIPVGINEGCSLMNISKEITKDGNPYLCFLFNDSNGNELKHMEFDVNPERVNPKPGESNDEAVSRRVNNMLVRIKHICTKFVDPDSFSVQGNNYDELCDSLVTFMGTKFQGVPVRLKVVYSWNDYSSLPNFCPFIETMDTNPSGLKINPKYDKMEKDSAEAQTEVASTDSSDLPF
tara:strand:+ start:3266 stop:3844 length:579 start_codon:yes stop_codon:yes gene_type:complete